MRGSWKIARVAGIGIFVHWTFLILPVLVGWHFYAERENRSDAVLGVALVLAVFACVALHELGHALTARQFGIATRDITLLPIGGVARLERMPERPLQELMVALAGPAVNVVIAIALAPIAWLESYFPLPFDLTPVGGSFSFAMITLNLFLAALNLLPAFPMDGGRVFRSLLALFLPYVKATGIAATLGQVMAGIFVLLGVFGNGSFMLIVVGLFVFVAARAEYNLVRTQATLAGLTVADVMLRRFRMLPAHATVADVVPTLVVSGQAAFPVVEADEMIGLVSKEKLLETLAGGHGRQSVGRLVHGPVPTVDPDDALGAVFVRLQTGPQRALPVMHDEHLVGLLDVGTVQRWMQVQVAWQRAGGAGRAPVHPDPLEPIEATLVDQ